MGDANINDEYSHEKISKSLQHFWVAVFQFDSKIKSTYPYYYLPHCHGRRIYFFHNFSPRKMTIYSTFLISMSEFFCSIHPSFEGIFIRILTGPFGIFNKIDALFDLSLTILPQSWISVKNQN